MTPDRADHRRSRSSATWRRCRSGPRARGRGAGAAVRRRAGDRGRHAHPGHAAGGGRDRRRHLARPGHRRDRPGPRRSRPAGCAPRASAPTCRRTCRWTEPGGQEPPSTAASSFSARYSASRSSRSAAQSSCVALLVEHDVVDAVLGGQRLGGDRDGQERGVAGAQVPHRPERPEHARVGEARPRARGGRLWRCSIRFTANGWVSLPPSTAPRISALHQALLAFDPVEVLAHQARLQRDVVERRLAVEAVRAGRPGRSSARGTWTTTPSSMSTISRNALRSSDRQPVQAGAGRAPRRCGRPGAAPPAVAASASLPGPTPGMSTHGVAAGSRSRTARAGRRSGAAASPGRCGPGRRASRSVLLRPGAVAAGSLPTSRIVVPGCDRAGLADGVRHPLEPAEGPPEPHDAEDQQGRERRRR